jgi:hypothetical protein
LGRRKGVGMESKDHTARKVFSFLPWFCPRLPLFVSHT